MATARSRAARCLLHPTAAKHDHSDVVQPVGDQPVLVAVQILHGDERLPRERLGSLELVELRQHDHEVVAACGHRLALVSERLGESDVNDARSLENLASATDELGRRDEAIALLEQAVAVLRRADSGATTEDLVRSLGPLALALVEAGRLGEAEPVAKEGLAIAERRAPRSRTHGLALSYLGRVVAAVDVAAEVLPDVVAQRLEDAVAREQGEEERRRAMSGPTSANCRPSVMA